MTEHYALFSGGHDSAVSTHIAMRWGPADVVIYLDTGTGLDANREYIESYCDHFGWHLWTLRTPENYEELVEKYGFPGPSKHVWFYQYLKERQIGKLVTKTNEDVELWTGVHRAESMNRMARVEEKAEDNSGRWTWRAPCAGWDTSDFDDYFDRFNLPRNELWDTLGRSGDCYCGAYGNRMELIDLDAIEADRGEWLRDLESNLDRDDERDEWAWHDNDKSAWAMDDPDQMLLCSDCGGVEYPMEDNDA